MRKKELYLSREEGNAKVAILLRNNGVVRYVVGIHGEDAFFANPAGPDDIILTKDMPRHIAISSHRYYFSPPSPQYKYNNNDALKKFPIWAVERLREFKLLNVLFDPIVSFVLCKANSSNHDLEKLERDLTTTLVSFEPRHNCINITWLPGSLICRRFRFNSKDIALAIDFTEQLIELSKNIINTHADLMALAEDYNKRIKPLTRRKEWDWKTKIGTWYPLLPKGETL